MLVSTLLSLFALGAVSNAAQSTKAASSNSKQAAGLQAAAVYLKPASYVFTNVASGQRITYVPKGNHIYPCKGKGSAISVSRYSDKKLPWHRFHFGLKNKCWSSAWGGGKVGNNAAVAYVCATGAKAQKTTLERTKQWWILVPVSRPTVKAPPKSYANTLLLAAQSDSIKTRNAKIAAQKAAFGRRSLSAAAGSRSRRHVLSKRALERRAKTAGVGTYYIIPTDHLMDMPARALTGKTYKARGITSTKLEVWKNGRKDQQWRVTKA